MERHYSVKKLEEKKGTLSVLDLGDNHELNIQLLREGNQTNPRNIIYSSSKLNPITQKFERYDLIYETNHPFIIHIKFTENNQESSNGFIYYHPMKESELKLFINQLNKRKKI
jgi:hypothetical protein